MRIIINKFTSGTYKILLLLVIFFIYTFSLPVYSNDKEENKKNEDSFHWIKPSYKMRLLVDSGSFSLMGGQFPGTQIETIGGGYGINIQYLTDLNFIQYGRFHVYSFGLLVEFQTIASNETMVYSSGIGMHGTMLYVFDLTLIFGGYSYFTHDLPRYVDENDQIKSGSSTGQYITVGWGLNIPIRSRFDLFIQFALTMYQVNDEKYEEMLMRHSIRLGLVYHL
jgi:hypothetical protein